MLQVDVVDTVTGFEELATDWNALYLRTGCKLPFLHHAWLCSWWKTFGRGKLGIKHRLMILKVTDGSHIVGILPLYCTSVGSPLPWAFKYVRPLGSDPNVTEFRTPLLEPGREREVLAVMGEYLTSPLRQWDLIHWGSLPHGLNLPESTTVLQRAEAGPPVEAFVLPLAPSWEELMKPLGRNLKEAIRKSYNALKRDNIEATFEVLTEVADIQQNLPTFFALHAMRSGKTDTVFHPDVFNQEHHRTFMHDVVAALSGSKVARLFLLKIHGRVVAARLGFVVDDTLYLYFSGFDPEFGKYSVMTRVVAEIVKHAIGSGLKQIHLSFGRDQSKVRWDPQVSTYHAYAHVRPWLRSRMLYAAFNWLRGLKKRRAPAAIAQPALETS